MEINSVFILRAVLSVCAGVFAIYFIKDCIANRKDFNKKKIVPLAIIGFVTDALDVLGIGCFATTQSGFKFTKSCDDELMPGTLNVGHTIPVVVEAILFFGLVEVEPVTLISMIAAAVVGAVVGASIVSKWPVKFIRVALGFALITVALIMISQILQIGPFANAAGDALGLTGVKLVIGVVINFFLGAFMTIGVGLYAPCLALVAMLGMNVGAAFPIMMGSCAFLMPAAGIKFVKEGKYDRKASLVVTIAGTIGVLVAYFVIESLNLETLRWIVIAVMFLTSTMFFRDAKKAKK